MAEETGSRQARGVPAGALFALQFRALRRLRRLTLEQLGKATGLDKGYLSRLERAQKAPSIATVMKIARALEVPVSALFGETIDDAAIHLVRASAGAPPVRADDEGTFIALSQATADPGVEAFLFHPGPAFRERGHVQHAGTEMIFVLGGPIEIRFTDRTLTLETGDFLQFPGHFPHQLRRGSEGACALILVSR